MKEFRFEPASQMITVEEGQSLSIDITGIKTAYRYDKPVAANKSVWTSKYLLTGFLQLLRSGAVSERGRREGRGRGGGGTGRVQPLQRRHRHRRGGTLPPPGSAGEHLLPPEDGPAWPR